MVVEWRNAGSAQGSGGIRETVSIACARIIDRDQVNGVEAQPGQAIALELVTSAGEVPLGNPLDVAVGIVELEFAGMTYDDPLLGDSALARVSFDTIAPGVSPLGIFVRALDDADGVSLSAFVGSASATVTRPAPAISEPPTLLPLGYGPLVLRAGSGRGVRSEGIRDS